jgi:hypothetical protein
MLLLKDHSYHSLLGKKELVEKISDNQSWSQDEGEAIEEVNALSTKMDDLLH